MRIGRNWNKIERGRTILGGVLAVTLSVAALAALPAAGQDSSGEALERIDYLTFAAGAIPVRIGGAGASLGSDYEAAVRIVDGDPTGFIFINRAPEDAETEFVYELAAPTRFDRFAVPGVLETPSPNTTFTRRVEVLGSPTGPDDGYVLLASADLQTHKRRGEVTELNVEAADQVRWIKLRLIGGIDVQDEVSFFEFSEIVGNGVQESPKMVEHFTGAWRRSALTLRLAQDGPAVSGCYEGDGVLNGTVTGNILRATGKTTANIPSAFIIGVSEEGSVRGVRSSNNGPFRLYELPAVEEDDPRLCGAPPAPTVGCGSILHGITFGFDSADILPGSEPLLAALYAGLSSDGSASILIEGHTSSEGSESYNQALSERRAGAVVADLVARGLSPSRLESVGVGEVRPIARNTDESGRSLNRRVEVHCR